MYIVTVSSRGQVVIPVEARKKLNIKEGDALLVHVEEGRRIVMKVDRKIQPAKGIVKETAGLLSDLDAGEDFVRSIRRESDRRIEDLEGSN